MDAWQVLDLSAFRGKVRSIRGGIRITDVDRDVEVPTADVAVVLFGIDTEFSSGVMHRLLGSGITVLFCDWRRVPVGAAHRWGEHSRVGARQLAQAQLSLPRRKHAWQQIIRAKIRGQASVLSSLEKNGAAQLSTLAGAVRSGDPENLEGQAARTYWQYLFGGSFRRQPGLGKGVNALLDYGYMVLRGHVLRETLAAGLWPALGVHHHNRSNGFALVDDLIEPFRPAVDFVVASLGKITSPDDHAAKARLVGAVDVPMGGLGVTVGTEITRLAARFAEFAEGASKQLIVHPWNGQAG